MMEQKIKKYIVQNQMIQAGDKIVIGVSGGADSICLFHLLLELRENLEFEMAVVHVNHQLRGAEALRDEKFVVALCKSQDVLCEVAAYNVKRMAKTAGLTLEEAGRMARREAFAVFAKKWGGNKIALAHHQNDVAETFLYHLARGSGMTGLCSLKPVRNEVIRPLLCMNRGEIEQYLNEKKILYHTDSTNLTSDYTRNKIRHEVIPYLEEKVNTKTVSHIAATSRILEEIENYLNKEAQRAFETYVTSTKQGCSIAESLFNQDIVIQKYVLRMVIEIVLGHLKNITQEHLDGILQLRDKGVGKAISLPCGVIAKLTYDGIEIVQKEKEEEIQKKVKQENEVEWEVFSYENQAIPENKYTKWFDYDRIKGSLAVRTRKAGDYITINAQGGTKKLKDYFIDCKIPREKRDNILLIAEESHILWVIGYRLSEYYKVTNQTKRILKAQLKGGKNHE